jgi:hypothetical protein
MQKFDFYMEVRVLRTTETESSGITDSVGVIMGISEGALEPSYSVSIDEISHMVAESGLAATGRVFSRDDFYDGSSIKVAPQHYTEATEENQLAFRSRGGTRPTIRPKNGVNRADEPGGGFVITKTLFLAKIIHCMGAKNLRGKKSLRESQVDNGALFALRAARGRGIGNFDYDETVAGDEAAIAGALTPSDGFPQGGGPGRGTRDADPRDPEGGGLGLP